MVVEPANFVVVAVAAVLVAVANFVVELVSAAASFVAELVFEAEKTIVRARVEIVDLCFVGQTYQAPCTSCLLGLSLTIGLSIHED